VDSSRRPLIAATFRFGELCSPFSFTGVCDGRSVRFVGVAGRVLDFVEEMMMRRLWWLLVLMLLPVADACADYVANPTGYQCNSSGWTKATLHDACQYLSGSISTPVPYAGGVARSVEFGGPYPAAMGCHTFNSAGAAFGDQTCRAMSYSCPYGGTLGTKVINSVVVYYCIGADPPPLCTDTNPFIRKFYYTSTPYIDPSNYAGCQVVALELLVCRTDSTGTYCMWKVQRNGQVYSGPDVQNGGKASDAPEVKTDPPTKSPPLPGQDPQACPNCIPCPAGSVQVGFDKDSIPICVGTGTEPQNPPAPPPVTTKPPVTTTNSDGSTVSTQDVVQTNSDGSTTTTTTTTTTGADGSKTVSVSASTSNTSTGTVGRQDTPNTDQMNLCKQNPNLTICSNSSVGGDCTSGLTCNGDAVQCATLMAAQKLQCARQADEDGLKASPSKTLGDAMLSGTDPSKSTIDAVIKGDTVDMSSPALDQTGFVGGGSCLPDKTFTVMGHAVTVSFATVCSNVQPLRYIVMACAFILVYLMVARSVING
jgi:hypothetical protein